MKQEKIKLDSNISKLKNELENTLEQYRMLLNQNKNDKQQLNRQLEILNNAGDGLRNGPNPGNKSSI